MSDDNNESKIPKGRVSRFAKLGGMASKIAGNMLTQGVSEFSKGNRPKIKDLLLTPANVTRVADQLAQMRGAAMKVGQLISMDAGDVLPEELSDLLAKLRSDAKAMPKHELHQVLASQWGADWQSQFIQFSPQPIAAASIGQVHKAITQDLQRLAIKVQYPGIKQSINSDVDNVATLLKFSGLLPPGLDLKPLLSAAKQQLHDEANYLLEGQRMAQYAALVEDDAAFTLPSWQQDLSTETVLAMSFEDGVAIESLVSAPQALRNQVVADLFRLLFVELFEHRLVQTDPNFANYQYCHETDKIVLLDFGATREFSEELVQGYLSLMQSGYQQQPEQVAASAKQIGLFSPTLPARVITIIQQLCFMACEPLYTEGEYQFADNDLPVRMRDLGMEIGFDKSYAHTPPAEAIFLHRKLGGLFLLATKLKAQVDVRALFAPYMNTVIVT